MSNAECLALLVGPGMMPHSGWQETENLLCRFPTVTSLV